MNDATSVYVIIVTYNAMKWIEHCLSSLCASKTPVHIVVIDNYSKDETVNYIKKHFPETYIIENKENMGFGQANNQGIEYAYKQGASHFFLLNQDAWIEPDTITYLVKEQTRRDIAVVSPIHLNGVGSEIDFGFYTGAILLGKNSFVSDLLLNDLRTAYEVPYVNAAAWMLSRRCIEEIGGFDPLFFHYGEDSNYCQRLQFHHESLMFVPSAFIYHDREIHGNQVLYDKRSTLNKLLTTYSNVNSPLIHPCVARFKIHGKFFIRSIKSICTLDGKGWLNIIKGYVSFFSKIVSIYNSRKTNRKRGANWLNL